MQKVLNVKKGDTVVVITGKDAGKKGKVVASYPKKNRVVVEGVNIITKHRKPRSAQDKGGIVKHEGTIDVSNVMIVCPSCGKATRVKHTVVDGKNVRVCKCGAVLDKKFVKAAAVKKAAKAETKEEPKAEPKAELKTTLKAKAAPKAESKKVEKAETKAAPKAVKATGTNKTASRVTTKVKKGDA